LRNPEPPGRRGLRIPSLVLSALLAFLIACDGGGSGGRSAAEVDSVTRNILGAIAADASSNEGAPPPGIAQEARPLVLERMGYNRGDAQAPVKVLEISDFGCGYCRRFHEEIFPALDEAYVETGLVEWKFVPFVLGMFPHAMEAAMAAECAGAQDGFFPMQHSLFANQSGWKNAEDPFPIFQEIAAREGLDADALGQCLEEGLRNDAVRADIRLGREIGVRGTPTFLIDGVPLSGALPLSTFRDILDIALTRKGLTPPDRGS